MHSWGLGQNRRCAACVEKPMVRATWRPHATHASVKTSKDRKDLPDSVFAFPKKRKEPLTDADHVRNAMARFDQVDGVSDAERDEAWANLKKAAKHFDVTVGEKDWHDLGKKPHTKNPSK